MNDEDDHQDELPIEDLPADILAIVEDAHAHPERLIRRRPPDDRR